MDRQVDDDVPITHAGARVKANLEMKWMIGSWVNRRFPKKGWVISS
jgi:hypothetical protein